MVGAGNQIHNSAALRFEIFNQHLSILPIDERSGSRNGRQPFPNLLCNLAWTLGAGKLQSETPLHGSVARAKFDQQLGQALGAEGFEVLPIERLFRGHVLVHSTG